jgi:hypothetical protein
LLANLRVGGSSPFAGCDLSEISAFDIDDGPAADAFNLRMGAQPTDALPGFIGADRAKDANLNRL